jgi:hypothetical protein
MSKKSCSLGTHQYFSHDPGLSIIILHMKSMRNYFLWKRWRLLRFISLKRFTILLGGMSTRNYRWSFMKSKIYIMHNIKTSIKYKKMHMLFWILELNHKFSQKKELNHKTFRISNIKYDKSLHANVENENQWKLSSFLYAKGKYYFLAKCDSTVEGLDWDLIDLHTACPLK